MRILVIEDDAEAAAAMVRGLAEAGHEAIVAADDTGKMSDPRFRAFAERAVRAVLDAQCANLPLPKSLLGRQNTLTFRFSP